MKQAATVLATGTMLALAGMSGAALAAGTNGNNNRNSHWHYSGQQNSQQQWQTQNMRHNNGNTRYQNSSNHNDGNTYYRNTTSRSNGNARYQSSTNRNQSNQSNQSQSQRQAAGGTVQGTIADVQAVLFNNGKTYILAKISDENGNTMVANLGPSNSFNGQNVNDYRGRQIQAIGRSGRLNNNPILVVYRFRFVPENNSGNGSNANNGNPRTAR